MHKTSIILAVHDGEQQEAQICIERLCTEFNDEDIELIAVDDVGKDGIADAFTEGIQQAEGDTFLLIRPSVYLFQPVYQRMFSMLWDNETVGMVTPVTNRTHIIYHHLFENGLSSVDENKLREFSCNRISDEEKIVEPALVIQDFCMMVKREAWESIGGFDLSFKGRSLLADADVSLRFWKQGWELLVLKDCYVAQDESSFRETQDELRASDLDYQYFLAKWRIRPEYSFYARTELLDMLKHKEKEGFTVLEAGCACGSTLMYVKYNNPTAKLYGIELDENSASVAKLFGQIYNLDLEKLSMPEWDERFDAIIMGDILEHLRDPWKTLEHMHRILNKDGRIVISVPNIMHISIFEELLNGNWEYRDSGILDKTHLRFFTQKTIISMLEACGFQIETLAYTRIPETEKEHKLKLNLSSLLDNTVNQEQLDAFQWLICARKQCKS